MKKKIEIIGKEIEIYKAKLFMFMAIAGGSWVYIFKIDTIFSIVLIITFVLATFGIFFNVLKLSDLQDILKEVRDA